MTSPPSEADAKIRRRFILVTGTSSGIGRACAIRLACEGFGVVASVRNDADAKSIEREGRNTPLGIYSVKFDVTDGASVLNAFSQIRAYVGIDGLCGLVNNAGICVVGPSECISLDDWRKQFDVNFFGMISVTQAMLPLLRIHNQAHGRWSARIVNMSSITGEVSTPLFGAYSASKFAVGALSDALRLELQGDGIRVCIIIPGTIRSEIWRKERECVDAIAPGSPARRMYGKLIDNVAEYVFQCAEKAIPADRVAQAVQKCFTSRRPRVRYRVGWEAGVGSHARKFLPDRLFDLLLGKKLGVPRAS
jgi:NAD(P)-dependent dehydrogenase (short-subunit alcohol dehydrogenase family)